MADASRSRAPFIAGVLALMLFGAAATWWMLRPEPPPVQPAPVVAPVEPEKPPELKLSEVSGTVEVKGPDGAWHSAKQGDVLNASDGVRTQDGSWAVLV